MAKFKEYASFDAIGLAELVRRKEVIPLELVEAAIERIERLNPSLNAVISRLCLTRPWPWPKRTCPRALSPASHFSLRISGPWLKASGCAWARLYLRISYRTMTMNWFFA